MTLSSRHRIRNSSPGGLRPSTLPLGHGGSPQYWLSHVNGEETYFVSFKPPRPVTEPRILPWKAAVLTTTLGPPPSQCPEGIPATHPVSRRDLFLHTPWRDPCLHTLCPGGIPAYTPRVQKGSLSKDLVSRRDPCLHTGVQKGALSTHPMKGSLPTQPMSRRDTCLQTPCPEGISVYTPRVKKGSLPTHPMPIRDNCLHTYTPSFKPPRPVTEPRILPWKAAVLTTTLGPPPSQCPEGIPATHPVSRRDLFLHTPWRDPCLHTLCPGGIPAYTPRVQKGSLSKDLVSRRDPCLHTGVQKGALSTHPMKGSLPTQPMSRRDTCLHTPCPEGISVYTPRVKKGSLPTHPMPIRDNCLHTRVQEGSLPTHPCPEGIPAYTPCVKKGSLPTHPVSRRDPCLHSQCPKWNESGIKPPLCTYRLDWARRNSWGWWDDWDDTVLQTQDSKFGPWRSEAEHATSRWRRIPTILPFTRGWGRNIFCFFQTAGTGNRTPNCGVKGSGANHYPRAPAQPVSRRDPCYTPRVQEGSLSTHPMKGSLPTHPVSKNDSYKHTPCQEMIPAYTPRVQKGSLPTHPCPEGIPAYTPRVQKESLPTHPVSRRDLCLHTPCPEGISAYTPRVQKRSLPTQPVSKMQWIGH